MVISLEFVEGFLLICAYHVGNVLGGVQIPNLGAGMLRHNEVTDRMYQMRLTKTDTSVNEQRVVGGTRMFGYLECRRAGELICLSRDEIVKCKVSDEASAKRCSGLGRLGLRCQPKCGHSGLGKLAQGERNPNGRGKKLRTHRLDTSKKTFLYPL